MKRLEVAEGLCVRKQAKGPVHQRSRAHHYWAQHQKICVSVSAGTRLLFCLLCSIPIQMAISRNTPHTQTKKINCARVAVTDVESRDFL